MDEAPTVLGRNLIQESLKCLLGNWKIRLPFFLSKQCGYGSLFCFNGETDLYFFGFQLNT